MATSAAPTKANPKPQDRSITFFHNGKPVTWAPRPDNFLLPHPLATPVHDIVPKIKDEKKPKKLRIRKTIRKIMVALRIRNRQKGVQVLTASPSSPNKQAFLRGWMSGSPSPPAVEEFSRRTGHATQEQKRDGPPRLTSEDSIFGRITPTFITRIGRGNKSIPHTNPLEGPSSQRGRQILSLSELAISTSPSSPSSSFFDTKEDRKPRIIRRIPGMRSLTGQEGGNKENVEDEEYVDMHTVGSAVNITLQDSPVDQQGSVSPATVKIPEDYREKAQPRSRRLFKPSVERILKGSSECSQDTHQIDTQLPIEQQGDCSKRSDAQSSLECGTSAKKENMPSTPGRFPLPGKSIIRSGLHITPDGSISSYAATTPASPTAASVFSKIQQWPLTPKDMRPKDESKNSSSLEFPILVTPLTASMNVSQSIEYINDDLENNLMPTTTPKIHTRGKDELTSRLLMEQSLPELNSYKGTRSGILMDTVSGDSIDEWEPSMPGSFTMASRSQVISLMKHCTARTETPQSFEDIDEFMARPEPLRQNEDSYAATPDPSPSLIIEGGYHSPSDWNILDPSGSPPMPGSWPSTPTFQSVPDHPLASPSPPNSVSGSWQVLPIPIPIPISNPSARVHMRGGGGGSALGLLSAKKYKPNLENGQKLLDQKISGLGSFVTLGWGKNMTYREFCVMMKRRAKLEKKLEKEKAEAEAKKKAEEEAKKAEAGPGALEGVINKMSMFGKKGKKHGGEAETAEEAAAEGAAAEA